jgi:2-oxoisovalerate dehydrogenase E1 component
VSIRTNVPIEHYSPGTGNRRAAARVGLDGALRRIDDASADASPLLRYPARFEQPAFYRALYPLMYLSRRLEERLIELFQKGYVKGTVTISIGNEATALPMTMPLRPGRDVVSLLHRDFGGHLVLGSTPYQLLCQYLANADSPTHGCEGNVHHGDAAQRRFPMISHLGKMLSLVVGGTWAARQAGEDALGLAAIGDGGCSTGEFHESLNIASVRRAPVLFVVENNHYAFSTPTRLQYNCASLADRAAAYGIEGRTVDGTDAWAVYTAVCDALEAMQRDSMPRILECMSLRLYGHAAYDKAEYVAAEQMSAWKARDPLDSTRSKLIDAAGLDEKAVAGIERRIDEEVQETVAAALKVARPSPALPVWNVYHDAAPPRVEPFSAPRVKNGEAVRLALDSILARQPQAFLMGLDIGPYGSAFKTCKGLIDTYGPDRVMDMPLCESALIGFALGASQVGGRAIVEFQFADFSTETGSQLGLNAGTWFFRTGQAAPLLVRLPCGGGLTMGAFHSGEFEGLWSRFPGLKLLYPATPQETYEAVLAGFYDPNPCLIFEHKLLYWSKLGPIAFDGDLASVWRSRLHREGTDATVVCIGAMLYEALTAASQSPHSLEVVNPFVLQPFDMQPILRSLQKTGRLLVVQECGQTQGLGDRIISLAARDGQTLLKCRPRLLAAPDVPVPFAPELESHYRPNAAKILDAVAEMVKES